MATLSYAVYCLHCGRLPLLNMPHRRLKEAAPFRVLHPAGNYVGKPAACWEVWSLCIFFCLLKDTKREGICAKGRDGRMEGLIFEDSLDIWSLFRSFMAFCSFNFPTLDMAFSHTFFE